MTLLGDAQTANQPLRRKTITILYSAYFRSPSIRKNCANHLIYRSSRFGILCGIKLKKHFWRILQVPGERALGTRILDKSPFSSKVIGFNTSLSTCISMHESARMTLQDWWSLLDWMMNSKSLGPFSFICEMVSCVSVMSSFRVSDSFPTSSFPSSSCIPPKRTGRGRYLQRQET